MSTSQSVGGPCGNQLRFGRRIKAKQPCSIYRLLVVDGMVVVASEQTSRIVRVVLLRSAYGFGSPEVHPD